MNTKLSLRSETKISKVWPCQAIYRKTRWINLKTKKDTNMGTSVIDCSHMVLHEKEYK